MVVMNEGVQASSQNLNRRHDFPTPLEPHGELICRVAQYQYQYQNRQLKATVLKVSVSVYFGIKYETLIRKS